MVEIAFQLGDPVEHRGIVITPLFPRRDPVAAYVTLDEALPRGFRVQEMSSAGSVAELLVENPLDEDVLLYDGEELVGAKQDRILNVSVLVAAGSKVPIPVSCVEQGRWSRRSDVFTAAPHAANPELRRRKARALRERPLERGIAQSEVWNAVSTRANELRVSSRTGASGDTYRALRPALAELERAFPVQPGQCGAVLGLGEDLCLDAVSRPGAFARLYPKLRAGYLLDAADRLDGPATQPETVSSFVTGLSSAAIARGPSAGRGDDLRLRGSGALGSGLALDGELIQLAAYTSEGDGPTPSAASRARAVDGDAVSSDRRPSGRERLTRPASSCIKPIG